MPSYPEELNEELLRSLPDMGPVVMVNLMRLRPDISAGEFGGYTRAVTSLVSAYGGTVLWAGKGEGVAMGDQVAGRWDFVALVQYRSRAIFLEMMTSPAFAEMNDRRVALVQDHVILAASQTFPLDRT